MKPIKRFFKRMVIRAIRARQRHALLHVAEAIRHEYPSNVSIEYIVNDLRSKS